MVEELIKTVTVWKQTSEGSVAVTVPKELGVQPGDRFKVLRDSKGRIIYEPIPKAIVDQMNEV